MIPLQVEIITIGDELISGMTTDTNASFIGRKLTEAGFEVRWISTVGDCNVDLEDALQRAYDRASIIILTGGLGPTHDDITRKTVAKFFDSKLVFREDLYEKIDMYFQKRGLPIASINREQAEIPEKAEIIENEIGTAAGLKFIKEGRTFFVLPGVPDEMKRMIEKSVLPSLHREGKAKVHRSLLLRTAGIAESELYHKIMDFNHRFPKIKLAFLPQVAGVV
ncbi:competence/damage-inducible protein A, partial [bacterium]|nr:competence/damage-inducible protein A [bacterium]